MFVGSKVGVAHLDNKGAESEVKESETQILTLQMAVS